MTETDLMSLIIMNNLLLCQNKICELEETKLSSVIKTVGDFKGPLTTILVDRLTDGI